jgi:hypothetical protein
MGHRSEATYKVPHFPPESRPTSIGISAPLALESVPHFARNPQIYRFDDWTIICRSPECLDAGILDGGEMSARFFISEFMRVSDSRWMYQLFLQR